MIYDTFSFFNELEILDIRLHELDSAADKFVLVEATKTYSGLDKPLYFNANKNQFSKYLDKIIHVILDKFPDEFPTDDTGNWLRENYQRNYFMNGLGDCQDEDIIVISDLDEIPRRSIFSAYNNFEGIGSNFYTVQQRLFYYYLNTYFPDFVWRGSTISNFKTLKSCNPQHFRNRRRRGIQIPDGGWHFSYMGGVNRIQYKISSFAHSEFDNDKFNNVEYLNGCMLNLKSYHTRENRGKKMVIGNIQEKGFLPEYVTNNLKRYKAFIR